MNALIYALEQVNYRTLIVLALVGLLLVSTIAVPVTLDLMAVDADADAVIAGGPPGMPKPPTQPGTRGFVWGG
jgi:hypothetical protein